MAEDKQLIPQGLLSRKAFLGDLQKFLNLSVADLEKLENLAEGENGFWPSGQCLRFSEQLLISPEDARAILTVAEYLYQRAGELSITPELGATELVKIGNSLRVDGVDQKREIFARMLRFKEAFEKGRRAVLRATEVIAHFEGLSGTWDIRPIFHRETDEIINKVAVLVLSVRWHDSSGTTSEAVFQLADKDWAEFKRDIEKLEKQRVVLLNELQRA